MNTGFRLWGLARLGAAALLVLTASKTSAQWSDDPAVNNPVAVAGAAQQNSVVASDGDGGAFIVWVDQRDFPESEADIYAQRIAVDGTPLWTLNGIPICTADQDQINPAITSDGEGGAIIVWEDGRNPGLAADLWAQRVDADGEIQWAEDGVVVCSWPGSQIWPMLVSDGYGGAIITWEDNRDGGFDFDIFVQRVNGAGGIEWVIPPPPIGTGPGLLICNLPGYQAMPMIVGDEDGGAIITWYDGGAVDMDIYAQRISGDGDIVWDVFPDGVMLTPDSTVTGERTQPTIAADGDGGAIVTWYDGRNIAASGYDIYAQRITAAGAITWSVLGLPICVAFGDQMYPKIVSTGGGSAIIAWQDGRTAAAFGPEIFAQRVTAAGGVSTEWPVEGAPVCFFPGGQEFPKIVSDGSGGAIVAWFDFRSGDISDIYAQRLDGTTGAPVWEVNGVAISTAGGNQSWQFQFVPMVEDGNGGAILTWNDWRVTPPAAPPDIYAQNVNGDGTLGYRPPPLAWWRFEEGSGTTASDATGNGHTGTFIGTPQFTTNVPWNTVGGVANNYSLNFDLGGPLPPFDAVAIPDSLTLRPDSAITVEAWVRGSPGGCVVSKQLYIGGFPPPDVSSFGLAAPGLTGGSASFTLSGPSGVETTVGGLPGPLSPDRWIHVAGTWDSASGLMRLYVNFVEIASAPFAGPIGYDASRVLIGADDNGPAWFFMGDLDEVRISGRALTPEEMLRTSGPLPPLVFVTAPIWGDTLTGGETTDITWVAIDDGGVSSIRIDFSSDGGVTYGMVADGEPNDSTYAWTVPPVNSEACWIKVTALDAAGDAGADSVGFRIATPIEAIDPPEVRPALALASPRPNPSAQPFAVAFSMAEPAGVDLAVYDIRGRLVRTLWSGPRSAGEHSILWDGRDEQGRAVASGVFLIRLDSGGRSLSRKAVLRR